MLTVEDYMKLPKKRLAELLVEKEKSQAGDLEAAPKPIGYPIYIDGRSEICPYTGKFCLNNFNCMNCLGSGSRTVSVIPASNTSSKENPE